MLGVIIEQLRTEARSHERLVNRCESSLTVLTQRGINGQRDALNETKADATFNAGAIRTAMALLQNVVDCDGEE